MESRRMSVQGRGLRLLAPWDDWVRGALGVLSYSRSQVCRCSRFKYTVEAAKNIQLKL